METTQAGTAKGIPGALDFVVRRDDLRSGRLVSADPASLEPGAGQALLRVDRFAFTANNVTYAVAGDLMSYWAFFPAPSGLGRVPVWGFADVLRSRADGIAQGERIFGYLPMSTHLVVRPERVTPLTFVDGSEHRRALPPVYNQYTRVAAEPGYARADEDAQMLFRPLFMTAFLLDDFLAESGFFGARAVVLSSASSKTAFGLAFLLHRNRRDRCEVIGLTSARNLDFVRRLGCYDRVVEYGQIASLPRDLPVAFVDMAGDGTVVSAVHHHFGAGVKQSTIVGLTHWERQAREGALPGAPPEFFFAPSRIEKRTQDWGGAGLQQRYGEAWRDFAGFVRAHLRVVHAHGPEAVERVYAEMVEGRIDPSEGYVLSLWKDDH